MNRVDVLRLAGRGGMRAAILAAVADSAAHGFTHLLTMSGDGRDRASDAKRLASVSAANPRDVILANRHGTTVPVRPWRGLASQDAKPDGLHGAADWIHDPENALRIYPLIHLHNMRFVRTGLDFNLDLLVRLLWRGVVIREVDVDGRNAGLERPTGRSSRFRRDVRHSTGRFALVVVSLLKSHRTPAEVGAAIGVGVFLGCTPFFGLHTFFALGVSWVLGLNVVYLWLGTQISNPFMAGLLTLGSVRTGRYILGSSSHSVGAISLEWLVGSLAVGSVLGIVTGLTSYFVAGTLQKRFRVLQRPPEP